MRRLSQGLLDVGCCCEISATLGGGVTCITLMQAKSAVMHKITLSSKLLHFTSFFLSDIVLYFSFSQFHTICLADFSWKDCSFLKHLWIGMDTSVARGILTFIYHAKHHAFLPGFGCFILLPLIWCTPLKIYLLLQVRTGALHC